MLNPGFGAGLGGGFFRFANGLGTAGAESVEPIPGLNPFILGICGAAPDGGGGGAGAANGGGLGADEDLCVSESDSEDCSSAPVSMPPLVFFNFGMPPAKRPPNWGADSIEAAPLPPPGPESLLLLFLFPDGTGGARDGGGLIPGTGGAPAIGPPPPAPAFVSTMGAERSFVCTDFSFRPLLISPSRAPCRTRQPIFLHCLVYLCDPR